MKLPRDDYMSERREHLITKARQEIGLNKRKSSSRREILVPDRPSDLHTPLVMSATNPLSSIGAGGKTITTPSHRHKTGFTAMNSDIPSDLLGSKNVQALTGQVKPRLPLGKRGNSLNHARLTKSSHHNDLVTSASEMAGDSTALSKHSKASRFNIEDPDRPATEFLPSASQ